MGASSFPYKSEEEIFDAECVIEAIESNDTSKLSAMNRENIKIKERIISAANKSMVANRLVHLLGRLNFSDVKQILAVGILYRA